MRILLYVIAMFCIVLNLSSCNPETISDEVVEPVACCGDDGLIPPPPPNGGD